MEKTHEWKPMGYNEIAAFKSVVATAPASRVSGRYTFIPTIQVVEQFDKAGFLPVKISEARAAEDRRGFQKHIIRFRHKDAQPVGIDGLFPEIVLTNSHDAGAAFVLLAGIYRLVCTNGQVVGEHLTGQHRVNHIGYTDQKVLAAVGSISEALPRIMGRVDEFKQIEVNAVDREVHAYLALIEKYGPEELVRRDFDPLLLAEPKRNEDRENNLWNSINVIQEKLVEKGAGIEHVTRHRGRGRRFWNSETHRYERRRYAYSSIRDSRPVMSPAENVKLNQKLWKIGEEVGGILKNEGHFHERLLDVIKKNVREEAERLTKLRQERGEMVIALTPDSIETL